MKSYCVRKCWAYSVSEVGLSRVAVFFYAEEIISFYFSKNHVGNYTYNVTVIKIM